MIQLIGLKSISSVEIREKFSISKEDIKDIYNKILEVCSEVLLISTCNRTEIYFNSEFLDREAIDNVFRSLDWDKSLIENIFYLKDIYVAKHLMEVACGFHSKILGEDQILGQVTDAYIEASKYKALKNELQKLFQIAITCGKEFKFTTKLYEIPVSASSIVAKEFEKRRLKTVMILGFGTMGKLVLKYLISSQAEKIYIGVRNLDAVDIQSYNMGNRIEFFNFDVRKNYYYKVDCIISCTSCDSSVIYKKDICDYKKIIFDLAIPRDVEESIYGMEKIEVYDIDSLSKMDDINKEKRKAKMYENRSIIDKYIDDFVKWQKIREVVPEIRAMKNVNEKLCSKRYKTYKNKKSTKNNDELVEMLIKSASKLYVNRAIEVLKEEQLKGRAEECMRIIEKIFCQES